jgi:hypothetical protein
MHITIKWLDRKKSIVVYEFTDEWTWDELQAAADMVDAMMKEVSHRVDVILDFSENTAEPPHKMLSHLRTGPLNKSENWGRGVFVGVSRFIRVILHTFMHVEPELSSRYAITHTVKDARVLITQWRAQPKQKT